MKSTKELSVDQSTTLIALLKDRFEKNRHRHKELKWDLIQSKLESNSDKLWSLYKMEESGGEPDVIEYDAATQEYIFYDCTIESPIGRRSLCYDNEALQSRKKDKPKNSALGMAEEMGIEILTQEQYRKLQEFEKCDNKTSSWILTPSNIRNLGGGLFCDRRYDVTFVYHNGVESYYAARGFRGTLRV